MELHATPIQCLPAPWVEVVKIHNGDVPSPKLASQLCSHAPLRIGLGEKKWVLGRFWRVRVRELKLSQFESSVFRSVSCPLQSGVTTNSWSRCPKKLSSLPRTLISFFLLQSRTMPRGKQMYKFQPYSGLSPEKQSREGASESFTIRWLHERHTKLAIA